MMQVDLVKCMGCGVCLEACSVEAISMVNGNAVIDVNTCLSCGACVEVCPEGAISEVEQPLTVQTGVIQPVKTQTIRPVRTTQPEKHLTWAAPVLSFIGHEIFPRLIDTLITALDRRLSSPSETQALLASDLEQKMNGGNRKQRRRRRGRQF